MPGRRGFKEKSFFKGFKLLLSFLVLDNKGGKLGKGKKNADSCNYPFTLNRNFTASPRWQLGFLFWSLCGSASEGGGAGFWEGELAGKSCSGLRGGSVRGRFAVQPRPPTRRARRRNAAFTFKNPDFYVSH